MSMSDEDTRMVNEAISAICEINEDNIGPLVPTENHDREPDPQSRIWNSDDSFTVPIITDYAM